MHIDLLPSTRRWLDESPAAPEIRAFADWMRIQHYSDFVIDQHVRRLLFVAPRLIGECFGTHAISQIHAVFAREQQPRSRRFRFLAAQRTYQRFLAADGRLIEPATSADAALCTIYDRYLLEVRGLSASTRHHHGLVVRQLLVHAHRDGRGLAALTRDAVEALVAQRSRALSRHSLQHEVAYMRAFLRYAHDHGLVAQRLDGLDTPRTYRDELPPQALPWQTVTRLLASIDQSTATGRRDLCILHLIAYYGLRPSDVVGLRCGSIDWERKVLRLAQRKTGSPLILPLDGRTLQLLRRYLRADRVGAGAHEPLFLRARCPMVPLERTAVGDIFRKHMRVAGLPDCRKHVYRLRHTLAMRLLSRGVGVKAIGDVLGHRSLIGTSAYLRLDVAMLRGVALDVPSGTGGHHA